jgi:hypothetical protein
MSIERKVPSRFATLGARPPSFWIKFVAILVAATYLAWLSFIHAAANTTWERSPDTALYYVPDHPLALSRKADELFAQRQDPATLAKVEAMAKQSLRGGALNPVAIRLLGYVADARGDTKKARDLMLLSQKVSRRDLGTQLWLIEDAVARNDKRAALNHYDIAMRATPSSYPILFPTLTGALGDPDVRIALAPIVRQAPVWLPAYLGDAINGIENPANLADVLVKAGRLPDEENYRNISNALLGQLAAKNKFPAFRQYYLSLKGGNKAAFQSASLTEATVNLAHPAAGWQAVENVGVGGVFSQPDAGGRFSLAAFAGSGERGEVMRKLLFLEPGSYRFQAQYAALDALSDAEIRWDMQCITPAGNVGKWFAATSVRAGDFAHTQDFTIDNDCRTQLLILQAAGGSSQLGAKFTLRSVDVVPK